MKYRFSEIILKTHIMTANSFSIYIYRLGTKQFQLFVLILFILLLFILLYHLYCYTIYIYYLFQYYFKCEGKK